MTLIVETQSRCVRANAYMYNHKVPPVIRFWRSETGPLTHCLPQNSRLICSTSFQAPLLTPDPIRMVWSTVDQIHSNPCEIPMKIPIRSLSVYKQSTTFATPTATGVGKHLPTRAPEIDVEKQLHKSPHLKGGACQDPKARPEVERQGVKTRPKPSHIPLSGGLKQKTNWLL